LDIRNFKIICISVACLLSSERNTLWLAYFWYQLLAHTVSLMFTDHVALTQRNHEQSFIITYLTKSTFISVDLYIVRLVGSSSSLRYGCVFLGLAGTGHPWLRVHSGSGGLAVSSEAVATEPEFM
jgi:hypothetical protein